MSDLFPQTPDYLSMALIILGLAAVIYVAALLIDNYLLTKGPGKSRSQ